MSRRHRKQSLNKGPSGQWENIGVPFTSEDGRFGAVRQTNHRDDRVLLKLPGREPFYINEDIVFDFADFLDDLSDAIEDEEF
jgi:hypothetical protein